MIKKTFLEKGLPYASELALKNTEDLKTIVYWNEANGIKMYRMSSDMFPWATEYKLEQLKDWSKIQQNLHIVGKYVKDFGQRLSFHPGPYNVLVSPNQKALDNTFIDLEMHGAIMDAIGLSKTPYNKINIHCNGVYGDKIAAMDRFCRNFEKLSDSVRGRLCVENDDKASMYSVKDLMYIHERIGIPITFDYHHHKFCTGGWSEQEALEAAISTWPSGITPAVHYSESKALHESDSKIKPQAHSDYIESLPNTYGHKVDVMVEAKAKELAIMKYIKHTI
jgi:UV DNA damage endonuclease